eukprot:GHVT01016879.1.p1 GENE.GHVT01016879.1~~GHVT01016879.1.p1  ORF type:complete len:100 (-),score=4.06 GHVT01016879.1:590-889(-)
MLLPPRFPVEFEFACLQKFERGELVSALPVRVSCFVCSLVPPSSSLLLPFVEFPLPLVLTALGQSVQIYCSLSCPCWASRFNKNSPAILGRVVSFASVA